MRIRGQGKVGQLLETATGYLHPLEDGPVARDWLAQFERVHLEVGCGKGAFLTALAQVYPRELFIGLEMYTPIIARAAARASVLGLTNTLFVETHALKAAAFIPPETCDRIYLNFSDPWPRRRNEIKRLTHPRYLQVFETLLRPEGFIEQKTDNPDFFAWTLRSLERAGWRVTETIRDLPANESGALGVGGAEPRFFQTEYETRFRALELPISYLKAHPPVKGLH